MKAASTAAPEQIALELRPGDVHIEWPFDGQMARRVVRRSNAKPTWKYPSYRMGRMLHAESPHERSFYMRLDVDPQVTSIKPQPVTLRYINRGIETWHVPDCLVTKTEEVPQLIEIKDSSDRELEEAFLRATLLRPDLLAQGYSYDVVTSDEILKEPYLSNARTLLRYGRKAPQPQVAMHVLALVEQLKGVTWRDAAEKLYPPYGRNVLANLILEGMCFFDQTELITETTLILTRADSHGDRDA